jgi:hypothetical protein
LPTTLLVTPVRVSPTGLGGFAGLHPEPQGEIFGRRVRARVTVTVAASSVNGIDAAMANVTRAVLSTARSELAQLGIHKLATAELGPRPAQVQGGGPQAAARRDVIFDVDYEFLKLPEETGGLIQTIPLDLDATLASNDPRVLVSGPFPPNALDRFEVVDDPAATTTAPSSWGFDATESAIVQTAAIRGGTNTPTPNKPGTLLLLRPSPVRLPVRDFSLAGEMLSTAQGGIGFVFRYIDVDNYSFALLDSRTGFRRIAKKSGGSFVAMADGGLDTDAGFGLGELMRVRLVAQAGAIRMLIDGATVLEARDDGPFEAGRVGLMTRHCTGGRFYDLTLLAL